MAGDSHECERTPLLTSPVRDTSEDYHNEETESDSWRRELASLWSLAISLWATGILETGSGGVTVALVGHIGTRELNALTIAILAYTTLILSGVIVGFACALDTAGSQGFTSSNPKLTSLYVQRVGVLIFTLLIPISVFLSFGEQWLLLLGQEKHVAQLAGKALRIILLQAPFVTIFELCKRWLTCQGLVKVPIRCAVFTAPFGWLLMYLLTIGPDSISIGFLGAPLATLLMHICSCTALLTYCYFWAPRTAWGGFTSAAFQDLRPMARLCLAGSVTVCSEWWSWDLTSIASSYLGPAPFAANSIAMFTTNFAYQLPFALMNASSIRVGNCLGAQNAGKARFAAKVAWVSTFCLGFCQLLTLYALRHRIGWLFTEDPEVIAVLADVVPLICSFQLWDEICAGSYGILRGSGLTVCLSIMGKAAWANLCGYWFFGIPCGFFLAFWYDFGLPGLWLGHNVALFAIATAGTVFVARIDWPERALDAKARTDSTEAFLQSRVASAREDREA